MATTPQPGRDLATPSMTINGLPLIAPHAGAADSPVLMGFSGGLDSCVLLHRLSGDAQARAAGLRAIHVHHGLHADADAWAAHCQRVCDALEVPLLVRHVTVDRSPGTGLEACARDARRAAFACAMGDDEIIALAHHRDDQAETFLLRALRGSGVDGLASMAAWRRFEHGWMWRPLLDTPRSALLAYAQQHGLHWINDPSNANDAFDRNYLRNRVLPLLRQRWPQADANLARSAQLCTESVALLDAEDAAALMAARIDTRTLRLDALRALTPERRARVLRRWIAELRLPPLPGKSMHAIEATVLCTRHDAQARVDWSGACLRRWRDCIHADWQRPPLAEDFHVEWEGRSPLQLPTGDVLHLHDAAGFDALLQTPLQTSLQVSARRGGERITLAGRRHSHALKHLLQEIAMPPWQRERLPLLVAGDELLAAGDGILSARLRQWLLDRQARLEWRRVA